MFNSLSLTGDFCVLVVAKDGLLSVKIFVSGRDSFYGNVNTSARSKPEATVAACARLSYWSKTVHKTKQPKDGNGRT